MRSLACGSRARDLAHHHARGGSAGCAIRPRIAVLQSQALPLRRVDGQRQLMKPLNWAAAMAQPARYIEMLTAACSSGRQRALLVARTDGTLAW
jgi:hypothetical protein